MVRTIPVGFIIRQNKQQSVHKANAQLLLECAIVARGSEQDTPPEGGGDGYDDAATSAAASWAAGEHAAAADVVFVLCLVLEPRGGVPSRSPGAHRNILTLGLYISHC